MALPDGKTRASITFEDDVLAAVDRIAAELEISRSAVVTACVETGLDDWKFFSCMGLTPRRMKMAIRKLRKLGSIREGDVRINLKERLKTGNEEMKGGAAC